MGNHEPAIGALCGSWPDSNRGLARPYIANAAAQDRYRLAGAGLRPRGGRRLPQDGRGLREGQRQQDRLSIMPFTALNQKAISALTSGEVPDLIFHDAPATILPQNAWDDKLVDVSDVVEAQKSKLSETALLNSSFYNSVTKQRSFYLAPVKQACAPFHIWGDLVAKAGFKLSDAPKTWDAFWDFFKPVQTELRAKGMRKLYAMGCRSPPSDRTTATACSPISWSPTVVRTSSPRTASCIPTIRRCARRRSGRSPT